MKRLILFILVISSAFYSFAQDFPKPTYKFYGFFRNYSIFDSRKTDAGTADLSLFSPLDRDIDANGIDQNAQPSLQMFAITTRLGVKINALQYKNLQLNSTVETDFNTLLGSTAVLRLRLAYVDFIWKNSANPKSVFSIQIGQAWHPMAIDIPYSINVERGMPFNPFNRSPLIMANYSMNANNMFSLALIHQMQFRSNGPGGKLIVYAKYSLIPELLLQWQFKAKGLTTKLGLDILTIRPRLSESKRLVSVSPYVYANYVRGDFAVNAKTIYAQAGDHISLLGSYGDIKPEAASTYTYSPMQSSVSFISAKYGKKYQIMAMLGYIKALGTSEDIDNYYSSKKSLPINQMLRFTPTIAYNLGGLTLALEYNITASQFGDDMNKRALYTSNLHWIVNHRISTMVKLNF